MNDPDTLGFYTTMLLFGKDPETAGQTLKFPPALTPQQRRIVHSLAIKLNLKASSHGIGTNCFVTVTTQGDRVWGFIQRRLKFGGNVESLIFEDARAYTFLVFIKHLSLR